MKKVKDVLEQWGVKATDDHLNSYRNLRRQKSTEENQAVTFNEESSNHKVSISSENSKVGKTQLNEIKKRNSENVSSKFFFPNDLSDNAGC